jgi:hypothetical protein
MVQIEYTHWYQNVWSWLGKHPIGLRPRSKYVTQCTGAHHSYGGNWTTANYITAGGNYGNYHKLHNSWEKLRSATVHYVDLGENYMVPITWDFTTKQPQLCNLHMLMLYCCFFLMFLLGFNSKWGTAIGVTGFHCRHSQTRHKM